MSDKCPKCGAKLTVCEFYGKAKRWTCGSHKHDGYDGGFPFVGRECLRRQLAQSEARNAEKDERIAVLKATLNAIPSAKRLTCSINFRREVIEDRKRRKAEAKLAAEAMKGSEG